MNAPKPWGGFDEWTVEDIRSLQAGLEAELAKRRVLGGSSLRAVAPPPTGARNLTWTDGRWHCGETPIHAGDAGRIRAAETGMWGPEGRWVPLGPGPWFSVRVESHDGGRVLLGFYGPPKGPTFVVTIGPDHELELL